VKWTHCYMKPEPKTQLEDIPRAPDPNPDLKITSGPLIRPYYYQRILHGFGMGILTYRDLKT